MGQIVRSKYFLGFLYFIWFVDILNYLLDNGTSIGCTGDNSQRLFISEITQSNSRPLFDPQSLDLCRRSIKGDGHTEQQPTVQP